MKRKDDCNTCGLDFCDIMRSKAPKFREEPAPKERLVILYGCRAWKPRPDICKGLGYLSDARHSLGSKS